MECEQCISETSFKNHIEQNMRVNTSGYYLAYNLDLGILYTIFGFYNYEPELNMNMISARVVTTLVEHEADFNEHKDFVDSGLSKTVLNLNWPTENYAHPLESYNPALPWGIYQTFAHANFGVRPLSWANYSYIKITFSNGDTMLIGVTGPGTSTAQFPVIIVLKQDGSVETYGSADVELVDGGGNAGGSTYFSISGSGVTWCWGRCSEGRTPIIIVAPDPE